MSTILIFLFGVALSSCVSCGLHPVGFTSASPSFRTTGFGDSINLRCGSLRHTHIYASPFPVWSQFHSASRGRRRRHVSGRESGVQLGCSPPWTGSCLCPCLCVREQLCLCRRVCAVCACLRRSPSKCARWDMCAPRVELSNLNVCAACQSCVRARLASVHPIGWSVILLSSLMGSLYRKTDVHVDASGPRHSVSRLVLFTLSALGAPAQSVPEYFHPGERTAQQRGVLQGGPRKHREHPRPGGAQLPARGPQPWRGRMHRCAEPGLWRGGGWGEEGAV